MITFDATTESEYLAESAPEAAANALIAALADQGTVYVKCYDGSANLKASGTMQTPWATASGAIVTVREAAGFQVSSGGTPDAATWYVRFEAGTRWVRGSLGPIGSGADFTNGMATWVTGQGVELGTVSFSVQTNAAPSLVGAPSTLSFVQGVGGGYNFGQHGTDPDGDSPLTYSLVGQAYGGISISTPGQLTVTAQASAGVRPLTIRITDPSGLSSDWLCTVTLQALAPSFTATGAIAPSTATVSSGGPLQFRAIDPNVGEVLVYSLVSPVPSGTTINSATGLVTMGSISGTVIVRATDPTGLYAQTSCVVTVQASQPGTNTVEPTYRPLQIIYPRAVGTYGFGAGSGLPSTHRVFYAYPGVEYNIRASVVGGSYPYTFSLSANALAAGMTINARTGEIRWPSPQVAQSGLSVTMTVTDGAGASSQGAWPITVGTAGWVFLDAVNGNDSTGTGTIGAPWRTLSKLLTSAGNNSRTYFRAGTYWAVENNPAADHFSSMNFRSTSNTSVIWLAYPGSSPGTVETVTVDQALSIATPGDFSSNGQICIEFANSSGEMPYVDGIRFINNHCKGVLVGVGSPSANNTAMTIRRCYFNGLYGHDGHNSGQISIRILTNPDNVLFERCGSTFQDNTFDAVGGEGVAIKTYGVYSGLWEDNTFGNSTTLSPGEGHVAFKGNVMKVTFRHNTSLGSVNQPLVGGNMAYFPTYPGHICGGEICYNNIRGGGSDSGITQMALRWQNGYEKDNWWIYRNTINGSMLAQDLQNRGSMTFWHNVIVNQYGNETPWPYLWDYNLDPARVTFPAADNLMSGSTDNIIDPNTGLLTGASVSHRGSRGHEIPGY